MPRGMMGFGRNRNTGSVPLPGTGQEMGGMTASDLGYNTPSSTNTGLGDFSNTDVFPVNSMPGVAPDNNSSSTPSQPDTSGLGNMDFGSIPLPEVGSSPSSTATSDSGGGFNSVIPAATPVGVPQGFNMNIFDSGGMGPLMDGTPNFAFTDLDPDPSKKGPKPFLP